MENKCAITMQFLPDFSQRQFELFEVDPTVLDGLLSGEQTMQIKSHQQVLSGLRSAALCTRDETFKLKKNETSNTMMVADLQEGLIYKQTQVIVELEKSITKKFQLAMQILQYPLFNVKEEKPLNN